MCVCAATESTKSMAASLPFESSGPTPVASAKAALGQLVRNLAVEWAPAVRVNAVSPWYTDTPLVRGVLEDPAYLERVLSVTPAGRIASAVEVAAPIGFLVSSSASYVTGQTLVVDGGFLARGF